MIKFANSRQSHAADAWFRQYYSHEMNRTELTRISIPPFNNAVLWINHRSYFGGLAR